MCVCVCGGDVVIVVCSVWDVVCSVCGVVRGTHRYVVPFMSGQQILLISNH